MRHEALQVPGDHTDPLAGGIFAGTHDAGLAWKKNSRWDIWREEDDLPCGWINPQAVAESDGRLYLGTMEGGLLATPDKGAPRWQQYGLDHGLPSMDVTAITPAENGRLWVGTRWGIVLVYSR